MEPVIIVNSWCYDAILNGVAKYKNEIYYFDCILTNGYHTTDEYNLTLLTDEIYKKMIENNEYFNEALSHDGIPILDDYIYERDQSAFEEVFENYYKNEFIYKTEQAYQNNLIIEEYLINNKPQIKVNAIFYIDNEEYSSFREKENIFENFPKDNIKVKWI